MKTVGPYDGINTEETTSDGSWHASQIYKDLRTVALRGVGERIENFRRLNIQPDDIFIASYLKSGNHWVSGVVKMLVSTDRHKYPPNFEIDNFVEKYDTDYIESVMSPRVISTHLPPEYLPSDMFEQRKGKVILLYRNPKDLIVSYYYFGNKRGFYNGSVNGVMELFMQNKLVGGDWFEYVKKQNDLSERYPAQTFLLQFEDLKNYGHREVHRLARFLGESVSDDEIDSILDLCSVKNMKNMLKSMSGFAAKSNAVLYRKGEIGDWKNHFNKDMNAAFDEMCNKKINGIGVKITFE